MSHWKILCDFDGTISLPDATDELLERCASAGWKVAEREWREGTIGSRECMTRQVALLDATPTEINRVLDDIPIDPDFSRFVALSGELGVELIIVSDGLDRAIQRILDNHGLGHLPVVANRLVQAGARGWRMESPHGADNCRVRSGTCKCACARRPGMAAHDLLLIGDGQSDICVADRADFVFAKSRLADYCAGADVPHRSIQGFGDATALLPELLAGFLTSGRPLPLPLQTEYA